MRIETKLYPENKTTALDFKVESATVMDVLSRLNIKPDTVVVIKDNDPIPIDDDVKDGDKLKIIKVASGG